MPCHAHFSENESYMSLDVHYSDYNNATVTVTVDASELPVGVTEATVYADAISRDCATVRITVLDSGVPTAQETWGALKNRYRK
jgi:hypothetical protein